MTDTQQNFTGSLPQTYRFSDIVGYGNSKSVYDLFYSFNSIHTQKSPNEESLNMWCQVTFLNFFQHTILYNWL